MLAIASEKIGDASRFSLENLPEALFNGAHCVVAHDNVDSVLQNPNLQLKDCNRRFLESYLLQIQNQSPWARLGEINANNHQFWRSELNRVFPNVKFSSRKGVAVRGPDNRFKYCRYTAYLECYNVNFSCLLVKNTASDGTPLEAAMLNGVVLPEGMYFVDYEIIIIPPDREFLNVLLEPECLAASEESSIQSEQNEDEDINDEVIEVEDIVAEDFQLLDFEAEDFEIVDIEAEDFEAEQRDRDRDEEQEVGQGEEQAFSSEDEGTVSSKDTVPPSPVTLPGRYDQPDPAFPIDAGFAHPIKVMSSASTVATPQPALESTNMQVEAPAFPTDTSQGNLDPHSNAVAAPDADRTPPRKRPYNEGDVLDQHGAGRKSDDEDDDPAPDGEGPGDGRERPAGGSGNSSSRTSRNPSPSSATSGHESSKSSSKEARHHSAFPTNPDPAAESLHDQADTAASALDLSGSQAGSWPHFDEATELVSAMTAFALDRIPSNRQLLSLTEALSGSSVDEIKQNGHTLLADAARRGDLLEVRRLVRVMGADLTVCSKLGWSLLTVAATQGHTETVKAPVEELGVGVNDQDQGGSTALFEAATGGKIMTEEALIRLGGDLNNLDKIGKTALTWAAYNGHTVIVKALVEEIGVGGHTETVKVLAERLGVRVNDQDQSGRSAVRVSNRAAASSEPGAARASRPRAPPAAPTPAPLSPDEVECAELTRQCEAVSLQALAAPATKQALELRGKLHAELQAAEEPEEDFELMSDLGLQLQQLNLDIPQLALSEEDYLLLPDKYTALVQRMEAKCQQLIESEQWVLLHGLMENIEVLKALNPSADDLSHANPEDNCASDPTCVGIPCRGGAAEAGKTEDEL